MRDDEQSATVRCHYLTDGTVNFAFTIRRSEYFIPAGVLLKCFMEVSDKELYEKLVKSALVVSHSRACSQPNTTMKQYDNCSECTNLCSVYNASTITCH